MSASISNLSPVAPTTDGQVPVVSTDISMIGPIPLVAIIVMFNLFVFACIAICISRHERAEAKKRPRLIMTNINIDRGSTGSWVAEEKIIIINEPNHSSIPMTTIKPHDESTLALLASLASSSSSSSSISVPVSSPPNVIVIESATAPASASPTPSATATPVSSPPQTP